MRNDQRNPKHWAGERILNACLTERRSALKSYRSLGDCMLRLRPPAAILFLCGSYPRAQKLLYKTPEMGIWENIFGTRKGF
jgi:hypothetical protein